MPEIRKDIRDLEPKDLYGFDSVIHLAALCNDPLSNLDSDLTDQINHLASIKLARSAKIAGIKRFIYSSSCSVYGMAHEDEFLTENSPLKPVGAYAISKVRSEEGIFNLSDAEFSSTYMRNATNYGISPRLRLDLMLNKLVAWAYTAQIIRVDREVELWRPLAHVEDVSRAFTAVLEAPQELVQNQVFNVGVAENYRIIDIIEVIREVIPGCALEYAIRKSVDPRSYRVDFSKLSNTFPSLNLKWNIRLGIQELFSTFRFLNLKQQDVESHRYIRLSHIEYLTKNGYLNNQFRWINQNPNRI